MERTARSASHCILLSFLVATLTAGCSAHAPEFGGRWRPVNVFPASTREIPLQRTTIFAASPVDRTLRALLQRWAREAGLRLDYRHGSDFTLHRAAGEVRTSDLREAIARLGLAYAPQRVLVSLEGDRIVVQGAGAHASEAPPTTKTSSAATTASTP